MICRILLFFFLFIPTLVFGQYTIGNLSNPKDQGQQYYVANPDGILSSSAVDSLNRILKGLDSKTSVEFVIVVIDEYVGNDDFSFAHTLFNKWGIGKKENNKGLLLLVAKDRREYRFITGYGLETELPDAILKRIGEQFLVPNFRKGNYDEGVKEAMGVIIKALGTSDEKFVLEKELLKKGLLSDIFAFFNIYTVSFLLFILLYTYIHFTTKYVLRGQNIDKTMYGAIINGCGCMGIGLFVLFIVLSLTNNSSSVFSLNNLPYFLIVQYLIWLTFKISAGHKMIGKSFIDSKDQYEAYKKYLMLNFVPMFLVPFSWSDLKIINEFLRINRKRFLPPDESGNWERLERGKDRIDISILNSGQQKEEEVGARRYEIWKNTLAGEILLVPWEISSKFGVCPQCGYYTYKMYVSRVITAASYSSPGEGETYSECANCLYEKHLSFYTIERLSEQTSRYDSSSSSAEDSYSGSSDSSSSSDSGGGSSGGGGAGGSW